ncbi:IS110 family transposase [Gottfriedia solisilvae]|uniref:IS110 family transposase n=1 Tax=Gottfriedia solisilvae TaxID=1516104 RepID=A0A8J3AGN2_9BACI|nr:IS110 family transposase [Gottfriedia solisilvae]GGI12983.1 IS110 family transposase [Gottfriedia solisilvae]
MNPVIGLDVSKGESEVQAFLNKGIPYGKSFKIYHTSEGLISFLHFLNDLENKSLVKPTVIRESTGHYQAPIIQFLEKYNYLYIVINPILSHQSKKTSLRKVKTDAMDAFHLCELFYKEELEPYKKRGINLLNLRHLTRQHEAITGLYVQAKLQFHTMLDQIFPEYRHVFGDLFSKVSLNLLNEFPTSETVLEVSEVTLADKIHSLCKTRSYQWALKKAAKLNEAAKNNPFENIVYQSHLVSLKMFIKMLLQYQEHLSILDEQIDTLARDIEEYEIIQSIPGIGEKIAATIISEIGEIERFNHPKKLVAYAGIDPSVHQSGKFTATINRITKRGSSRLRHVLYMAVLCGIRSSRNKRLKEFYDRKREEGKPSKVAIIACVNKLLHWIYTLMKRKETFLDLS